MSTSAKTYYRKAIASDSKMIGYCRSQMCSAFAARHGDYQWTPEEARKRFNKANRERKYWTRQLAKDSKKYTELFN